MTYWADGRLKDVTDPRGFVTRFDVDWTNRQNLIKFALGTSLEQTVKETFDTVGFITESIDGLGHKVTYVPDTFHRLSQIKDHYGTVKLTNTFDNLSQVTHQADGLSETTEYKIDELFRVYKIIDPNSNTTQTQFDASDQAVGFIDGLGKTWLEVYDVIGMPRVTQRGHGLFRSATATQ